MKQLLHILKSSSDRHALSVIEELSRTHPSGMKVVLIQEGKKIKPQWKAATFILKDKDSASSPPPEGVEEIDYGRFIDLMFESDSIVSW
ncbi:MAG: hypothetical protein ACYDBV_02410 [Nitrospiria bacterium]